MIRSATQNARLHSLISELNIDAEHKEELVYQFTEGREVSSAKMEVMECQSLINHLANLKTVKGNKVDRQRKKILSICYEMEWTIKGKTDWKRLKDYLLKYGYLHKDLNDYTATEIPTLVTQFENLLKSYYAKR